jgi:hypothetical protein
MLLHPQSAGIDYALIQSSRQPFAAAMNRRAVSMAP